MNNNKSRYQELHPGRCVFYSETSMHVYRSNTRVRGETWNGRFNTEDDVGWALTYITYLTRGFIYVCIYRDMHRHYRLSKPKAAELGPRRATSYTHSLRIRSTAITTLMFEELGHYTIGVYTRISIDTWYISHSIVAIPVPYKKPMHTRPLATTRCCHLLRALRCYISFTEVPIGKW